jgi:hypothetical protein
MEVFRLTVNNNVDFKSIVNNALNVPLTVRPNDVEINTTTNPACVIKSTASGAGGTLRINNYANNNASIGFYNNLDEYWATGMRANNFVIYSNYLTTNDSNNAIANDVGIQINQDGYLNLPHDTSIYGDIICE